MARSVLLIYFVLSEGIIFTYYRSMLFTESNKNLKKSYKNHENILSANAEVSWI